MEYIPREIEKIIEQTKKTFKVVFLSGPRQVGKTTVLKQLFDKQKTSYISLDDINQRDLARRDPQLFLQQLKLPVLIDEIQYAPGVFPYIKKMVDDSDRTGQFILTGSQQFSVLKGIQESLAGRVAILNLLGLSRREKKLKGKPNIQALFQEIFIGGYPVFSQKNPPDRDIYLNSYIQTYLDRDLSDIFGINKIVEFNRFMQVCAARTGQLLNISDMARDSGISTTTAVDWLHILERTMQIYLLQPYYPNITKRIIKSPKLYFLDTGMATYLTKWNTSKNAQAGSLAGALFETFIVSEYIKHFVHNGKQPSLYYLRDKERHEVDLVVEENGLHLIEIKLTATVHQDHSKNLEYFASKSPSFVSKSIVSLVPAPLMVPHGISYIPYTSIP